MSYLVSFHYFQKIQLRKTIESNPQPLSRPKRLMGDSGAFSAFTQGAVINPGEYSRWLKTHADMFTVYPCLDVIGDPVATRRSWEDMTREGLSPIPVIHLGASLDVLRSYIDDGVDYVALGGMVGWRGGDLEGWIDRMMSLGYQNGVGFHGFGMTQIDLAKRWPWRSVDSSSWLGGARYGIAQYLTHDLRLVRVGAKDAMKHSAGLRRAGYPIPRFAAGKMTRPELVDRAFLTWSELSDRLEAWHALQRHPWDFTLYLAGSNAWDISTKLATINEDPNP